MNHPTLDGDVSRTMHLQGREVGFKYGFDGLEVEFTMPMQSIRLGLNYPMTLSCR